MFEQGGAGGSASQDGKYCIVLRSTGPRKDAEERRERKPALYSRSIVRILDERSSLKY